MITINQLGKGHRCGSSYVCVITANYTIISSSCVLKLKRHHATYNSWYHSLLVKIGEPTLGSLCPISLAKIKGYNSVILETHNLELFLVIRNFHMGAPAEGYDLVLLEVCHFEHKFE